MSKAGDKKYRSGIVVYTTSIVNSFISLSIGNFEVNTNNIFDIEKRFYHTQIFRVMLCFRL
jgi:hypothetical protein